MLDVLHFLFEEDTIYTSSEHYESKDSMRKVVYKNFYETDYIYASDKSQSSGSFDYGFDDLDGPINDIPDVKKETKPYFPPTNFDPDAANPFGTALRETPLG